MGKSKRSSTLGVHLDNFIIDEIVRRAALLGWSKSQYAAEVLIRWYEAGAQPVNNLETASLLPRPRDPRDPLSPVTFVGAQPAASRPQVTRSVTPEPVKFPRAHKAAIPKHTAGGARKTAS